MLGSNAEGCSLKLRSKLLVLVGVVLAFASSAAAQGPLGSGVGPLPDYKKRGGEPVNITGKEFVYDRQTDTFIVRGNAQLTQLTSDLCADELEYQRSTKRAIAIGHVHLIDPDLELGAARAELDLDDETGELDNATVNAKTRSFYMAGKKLRKLLGQQYSIEDGMFTTCGCEKGRPSWSIGARQLDVHLGQTGTVRNARFNILDHPVIWLPYAVFPADTERSSGFLSPRLGQSRIRGFQYMQPYFVNINKSMDATVAFDVETSARVGGLAEYRLRNGDDDYLQFTAAYMNEKIRKNAQGDVIDKEIADTTIPQSRFSFIGLTRQHITPDLVVYGDGVSSSDDLYFRDMNIYTLSRGYGSNFGVLRDAISRVGAQQDFSNSFIRAEGVWNQDLIQPQRFALQTAPELLWSGRQKLFGGLAFSDFDAQGVNFYRVQGLQGQRFDAFPRLTIPWRFKEYAYGYLGGGIRETVYGSSGHNIGIIPIGIDGRVNNNALFLDGLSEGGFDHRELIYGNAGISSVLQKIYRLHMFSLRALKHTIEPVANYAFVPVVAQTDLPLFDQIDRVNPRSLVTYGLTSRLYAKWDGGTEKRDKDDDQIAPELQTLEPAEVVGKAAGPVSEIARFTALQSYDVLHPITPDGFRSSDVDASLTLFPTRLFAFSSTIGFDPRKDELTNANATMTIRPPWESTSKQPLTGRALSGGPFLQAGYTFLDTQQRVSQINGRAYWEFWKRIGLYWEPQYNITDHHLISSEYGLRLKSECECWIVDVGITDKQNPREVQTLFQVTLGGLGSAGKNPFGSNPLGYNAPPN